MYPLLNSWGGFCLQASLQLIMVLILSSCTGGGTPQTVQAPATAPDLIFAFPYDEQEDVPISTPIALKFNKPSINSDTVKKILLLDDEGNAVAINTVVTQTDDGSNETMVNILPTQKLQAGQNYQIDVQAALQDLGGAGRKNLAFATRTHNGSAFVIEHSMPAKDFPLADFSSLFFRFSKALDTQTLVLEKSVLFFCHSTGVAVAANLVMADKYLTIDPLHNLSPDCQYELAFSADIKSINGDVLEPISFSYKPVTSESGLEKSFQITSESANERSILNGELVNTIKISNGLLGDKHQSKLSGTLKADLVHLPYYPHVAPLRIKKGSKLHADSIDVLLGGAIATGLTTGPITLTVVSDGLGYILDNQFSTDPYALKNVLVIMDAVLSTENKTANSILNQELQHVELLGSLYAKDGTLQLEAIGAVELKLLRQIEAAGQLVIKGKSIENSASNNSSNTSKNAAQNLPNAEFSLYAFYPTNQTDSVAVNDEVLLQFNDLVAEDSVQPGAAVKVYRVGETLEPVGFDVKINASSVKLLPWLPWEAGARYKVMVANGVTNLDGYPLRQAVQFEFSLPEFTLTDTKPAMVRSIYPGYPCVLTSSDYAQNDAGRCLGGLKTDDHFPLFNLPADRSLFVNFTRPIAAESVVRGEACGEGSLRVEEIDIDGNCLNAVAGDLVVDSTKLTFMPALPWKIDALYRLVLVSSDDDQRCDEGEICSQGLPELPLNTDPLNVNLGVLGVNVESDIGGPPMIMPFRGSAPSMATLLAPTVSPYTDINSNGFMDAEEQPRFENSLKIQIDKYSGIVNRASLGCDLFPHYPKSKSVPDRTENCDPATQYSFIGNDLLVDVQQYDLADKSLRVEIIPQIIYGTSVKLFAKTFGGLIPLEIDTGLIVLRTRQNAGNPLVGRVIAGQLDEFGKPLPAQFEVEILSYLDVPYLQILDGIIGTNLHSLPVKYKVSGPLEFLPNGSLTIRLANDVPIDLPISLYALQPDTLKTLLGNNIFTNFIDAVGSHIKLASLQGVIPAQGISLKLENH